jgi:hypothetical protein
MKLAHQEGVQDLTLTAVVIEFFSGNRKLKTKSASVCDVIFAAVAE